MSDSHDVPEPCIRGRGEESHAGAHGHTLEFSRGDVSFEGHTHAMASVVSLKVALLPGARIELAALASTLEALARDIERKGGVVGHIKAFSSSEAGSMRISIVDACRPALVQGPADALLNDGSCLHAAVIALAIDLELLIDMVCEAMRNMLG